MVGHSECAEVLFHYTVGVKTIATQQNGHSRKDTTLRIIAAGPQCPGNQVLM